MIYKFGTKSEGEGDRMGRIRLNKSSEMITEFTPYTGESGGGSFCFKQACYCVAKCYKQNKYPNKMSRQI